MGCCRYEEKQRVAIEETKVAKDNEWKQELKRVETQMQDRVDTANAQREEFLQLYTKVSYNSVN